MPPTIDEILRAIPDLDPASLRRLDDEVAREAGRRQKQEEISHELYRRGHMFGFLSPRTERAGQSTIVAVG